MKKTKHKIITGIGFAILVLIAVLTGDGYMDSYLDGISVGTYCLSIIWVFVRLNGFLDIEEWF